MKIDRSNLQHTIEIIGILSVVASLIFVGLEIQQNSAVSQVQSQQATASLFSQASIVAAQDPELAELLFSVNIGRIALEDLDTSQNARLYFWYLLVLQSWQSIYLSVQAGVSPESELVGITDSNVINPFVRLRWNALKVNLNNEFSEYVQSVVDI